MAEKDIISKKLLKTLALDIAQLLLKLDVTDAEVVDADYQKIESRQADLVAKMSGEKSANGKEQEFIMHIEIQNDNHPEMLMRMLRYRSEIMAHHPNIEIRQYLIYIGDAALNMQSILNEHDIEYSYTILDMHKIDCEQILAINTPDAVVISILCDFKGKPAQEVINYLVKKLEELTGNNETQFREYISMMEVLSGNRGYQELIKESEEMLSQVKLTDLPSYQIVKERGIKQEAVSSKKRYTRKIEEGKREGKTEEKMQITKNLLDILDDETIATKTGLDLEIIKKLRLDKL